MDIKTGKNDQNRPGAQANLSKNQPQVKAKNIAKDDFLSHNKELPAVPKQLTRPPHNAQAHEASDKKELPAIPDVHLEGRPNRAPVGLGDKIRPHPAIRRVARHQIRDYRLKMANTAPRSGMSSWQNKSNESFFATAPSPFKEIYALDIALPAIFHASIAKQLRFFATMEGPAEAFSIHLPSAAHGMGVFNPENSFADMKSFVRDVLQDRSKNFFSIILRGSRDQISIHGEDNDNIGKTLYNISSEFRSALEIVYNQCQKEGTNQPLQELFLAISNWCFDGSINQLNRFLQEQDFSGENLSLVPNLDNKSTTKQLAGEYARIFRLHQARLYSKDKGSAPQDSQGELAPEFAERYFNKSTFLNFLETSGSSSMLTPKQRIDMVKSTVDMGLFADND